MRIDKFLSNLKYGSRDTIKKLIKQKHVLVNDQVVKKENLNIDPIKDIIKINNEIVYYKETITLLLNKPQDYVCANIDNLHKTVIDLLDDKYKRFDFKICGRLDIDTTGLVILTTSGELVHSITQPKSNVFKKYLVGLEYDLINYEHLLTGIIINDKDMKEYTTKPAKILVVDSKTCYIEIQEGKFHQVKRMFAAIGNKVISLHRVSIGDYILPKNLKPGEYCEYQEEKKDII